MEERNQKMSKKKWCGQWISLSSRNPNIHSGEALLGSKIESSSRLHLIKKKKKPKP